MAFRIHASVVRGEIDNRVRGMVRGQIWLEGQSEPLRLELAGNAWPDLAGCRLTFTNSQTPVPLAYQESLDSVQRGSVGDLTASRKVRVFDVPPVEALSMFHRNESPPEHLANCLYLEWFSQTNGRVVIESADYELVISPPEWRMTPQEEEERARQAAAGMDDFVRRLTQNIERHQRGQKDPEEDWDEHDYEKFLKECDARTDKYLELLDKYGDSEEAEVRIAEEMGWNFDDDADEEQHLSVDDINAACEAAAAQEPPQPDPLREGIDWIRAEEGEVRHPLQHRCFQSALKALRLVRELGLDESADPDLERFIAEFQTTGAKLAGALSGIAAGEDFVDSAFTVAYLKRALDHLHKAQAGLEAVAPKELLPKASLIEARRELFEIREAILRLMDEFRHRDRG